MRKTGNIIEMEGVRDERGAPATTPLMRRLADLQAEGISRRQILEAAFRLFDGGVEPGDRLMDPGSIARYVSKRYGIVDQQVMGALYLNTTGRLLSEREVFRGTIGRMAIEPRAIMAETLRLGALGFVLFRACPGEDIQPTPEDLAFCERLAKATELLGVQFIDYLIVAPSGRVKSRERKWSF